MNFSSIDLFCHVIDNFGDAGVAYRFCREFRHAHPSCRVRLFIDDVSIIPGFQHTLRPQCTDWEKNDGNDFFVLDSSGLTDELCNSLGCADVLVELFGCHTPDSYLNRAIFATPLIINLEYLSAEPWIEGYHCKESLLASGSAKKFFFMPGFSEKSGGVLFNSLLRGRAKEIVADRLGYVRQLLARCRVNITLDADTMIGSVFTYERGFDTLLAELHRMGRQTLLLCFGQKSQLGMEQTLLRSGLEKKEGALLRSRNVDVVMMPFIAQHEYDALLYCTDFNLVRGEDSLVQAIVAGKPFIWNAYLQDDLYQQVKVDAFCSFASGFFDDEDVLTAYRDMMLAFNGADAETPYQTTNEQYALFFSNFKKIEHAAEKMCYFLTRNCNLVEKFSDFISEFNK